MRDYSEVQWKVPREKRIVDMDIAEFTETQANQIAAKSPSLEPWKQAVADAIEAAGGLPTAEAIEVCEDHLERLAMIMAAQRFVPLIHGVERTPVGMAMLRVLIGTGGETLRAAAMRAGCRAPTLSNLERRLKAVLANGCIDEGQ